MAVKYKLCFSVECVGAHVLSIAFVGHRYVWSAVISSQEASAQAKAFTQHRAHETLVWLM